VHQFFIAGSLAAPTKLAAAALDFQPPASIFVVVVFPASLSPA
jgi:hypothetical protein